MPNGSKETSRKDVAVYIDYENLYISLRSTVGKNPNFDVIMDKCREFGRLTITRAYADWSEFARVVTSQLFASGVEPIYVPTRKFYDAKTRSQATKNSVDIHITIDIMKMVPTEEVDCFVLVSGDRDFVPLMNQIRAAGKEVYAIGVAGCTSSELAVAVDEMFYYHQLLETDEELASEQRDVYQKLMRAVEIARARGYRATLGVVKPIMREVIVGFDERKFRNSKGVPFQKFKQLCQEAEKQGFIRLAEGGGDSVELLLAKDAGPVPARPVDRTDRPDRGGRGERRDAPPRAERRPQEGEPAEGEVEEGSVAEGGEGVAAAEPSAGGGRRRGRRGGRGRGRRGRGGVAGAEAGNGNGEGLDATSDEEADAAEAAEEDREEAEAEGQDAEDREALRRAARAAGSREREEERRREDDARYAAAVAPPASASDDESDDEDEDDEDGDIPMGEAAMLPAEAFDDLRDVMSRFVGRAPSQRRLIKQLKKEASQGDLRGNYREGQFLLIVRKALHEGVLEKISKGFYSGLRLKGETGAEAAAAD